MYYVQTPGERTEPTLLTNVWPFINSNQTEGSAQRVFIIFKTSTVITVN